MGEAWPPGRLHKCSHLIRSRAGGSARVWVGGAGRGAAARGRVSCRGPGSGLGGEEPAGARRPPPKPGGARGRGPGLPAGSTA